MTRGGATYDAEVNAVSLVGTDDLSVGSQETHRVLLGARVVIVEGLDFTGVARGWYDVFCGPVKLEDADGAPARVPLRRPGAQPA